MNIQIRTMNQDDAEACGRICYEAFKNIADRHNFRPDFPSLEFAVQLARGYQASPQIYAIVAESDGQILGSNYLWEYDEIRAVGPVSVDPNIQAKGVGRKLMEAVIERGATSPGIRLVQDPFNTISLPLYAALGFDIKEPLVLIEGPIKGNLPLDIEVRAMRAEDFAECAQLSQKVLGFARINELKNTPPFLTSFVAVREGRVVAYISAPHFWPLNHAVAEHEEEMKALLTGVGNLSNAQPLSLLVPMRQSDLFRWCLKQGMRVIKPGTLMAMGQYQEPRGCSLPSVGY